MKKYSLYGRVKSNTGEIYPYHVIFDINNNKISGYSATTQPDGVEFNAQITGYIDRKKHTLTINEIRALDHQTQEICLFSGNLTYKLNDGTFICSGTFIGRNLEHKLCTEGTMEFEEINEPGSIFHEMKTPTPAPTPPKKPEIPKPDTNATKKEPIPPNTITEGVQKQIDWTTDSCVLEVWDGGVIDGDVITVLYNDVPVLTNYMLEKAHKQLRMPVTNKVNTITIVAIDEGANPPNTADIALTDGGVHYRMSAYNNKGKRAIIVLSKK